MQRRGDVQPQRQQLLERQRPGLVDQLAQRRALEVLDQQVRKAAVERRRRSRARAPGGRAARARRPRGAGRAARPGRPRGRGAAPWPPARRAGGRPRPGTPRSAGRRRAGAARCGRARSRRPPRGPRSGALARQPAGRRRDGRRRRRTVTRSPRTVSVARAHTSSSHLVAARRRGRERRRPAVGGRRRARLARATALRRPARARAPRRAPAPRAASDRGDGAGRWAVGQGAGRRGRAADGVTTGCMRRVAAIARRPARCPIAGRRSNRVRPSSCRARRAAGPAILFADGGRRALRLPRRVRRRGPARRRWWRGWPAASARSTRSRSAGWPARPTPLLGGLAIFAGVLIAAALFLPINEQMRGILLARRADHDRRRDRRRARPAAGVKLAGQVPAALVLVDAGVAWTTSRCPFVGARRLRRASAGRSPCSASSPMMNVVNFSDGVDGLAAGVCAISAAAFAVIAFDLGARRRRRAGRDRRRAPRSASSSTTSTPRRSSWATAARTCSACCSAAIIVEGSLKTNALIALVVPARRARRAVPRHRLRGGEADQVPAAGLPRRLQPLPPPLPPDRVLASAGRCSTSTRGRSPWPASRSRCASCRTRTTAATCDPGWTRGRWPRCFVDRARGQRLPRLRARDPQAAPAARVAAPPHRPGHDRVRDRRERQPRARDRRVPGRLGFESVRLTALAVTPGAPVSSCEPYDRPHTRKEVSRTDAEHAPPVQMAYRHGRRRAPASAPARALAAFLGRGQQHHCRP